MSIILPTSYLPPVTYISAIVRSEKFQVEIQETYRKQSCRNHCRIYGPNGIQTLIVPVIKVNGNHTLTRDIRISSSLSWQKNHWRSIETAYRNSPFFLYYQDLFEYHFEKKYNFLIDLNSSLLQSVFDALKVSLKTSFTEEFLKPSLNNPGEYLVSKKYTPSCPPYHQVFFSKFGFVPNLSIIDVLFNLGPETNSYLNTV